MSDTIKLDEQGRVLNSDVEFLQILAENYQHVLFGDMSHTSLDLEKIMAKPETLLGLEFGGTTQLHSESDQYGQQLLNLMNENKGALLKAIDARDPRIFKLIYKLAERNADTTWHRAAGVVKEATELEAAHIITMLGLDMNMHYSDDHQPIREFEEQLPKEKVLLYRALHEMVANLRGGQSLDDITPKNAVEQKALDHMRFEEWIISTDQEVFEEGLRAEFGNDADVQREIDRIKQKTDQFLLDHEGFAEYLHGIVKVRDEQNQGLANGIAQSCENTTCATKFGNGHVNGEHDLDEMLPNAVSIAVGGEIKEIAAKLREAVDPNDYAYAADEEAYYHVPTVLAQSADSLVK